VVVDAQDRPTFDDPHYLSHLLVLIQTEEVHAVVFCLPGKMLNEGARQSAGARRSTFPLVGM
jgi:hypothetical protein